jgi:hypothetical protein
MVGWQCEQDVRGLGLVSECMDRPESKVQSFIVKLWLEEPSEETGRAVWHGHITHVPGGERRYLKKLSDIKDFIERYLGDAAIKRGRGFRLGAWLRRWSISQTKRR